VDLGASVAADLGSGSEGDGAVSSLGEEADLGGAFSGGISRVERSSSGSARTPILVPTVTAFAPSWTCHCLLEGIVFVVEERQIYCYFGQFAVILCFDVHCCLIGFYF
jgi:hypothetical protein